MAKIIKGHHPPPESSTPTKQSSGKVIEQEVILGHEEARRIVEKAQARARAIVEEARGESAAVKAESQDQGYAEGLAQWESKIVLVREHMEKQLEEVRPQLIQLALKVAEKILRSHIEVHPESVVAMVEEALVATHGVRGGQIFIHAHPEDANTLDSRFSILRERDNRYQGLQVIGDAKISRGGCRIETDFGTIDASVETQFNAIEKLLEGGW